MHVAQKTQLPHPSLVEEKPVKRNFSEKLAIQKCLKLPTRDITYPQISYLSNRNGDTQQIRSH